MHTAEMFRAALLLTLVACGACQDDRTPRFMGGLMQAGADVQRRIGALHRSFGSDLGYLGRNIEEQISDSLPPYMRSRAAQDVEGQVEAVVGSLGGGGVDDGLEVIMEGEDISLPSPEAPRLPHPTFSIFPTPASPPSTSLRGPGFKLRFNFDDAFGGLFFDRAGFRWGERPKAWWQGENVCIQETVVDEGENSTSSSGARLLGILMSSSMEQKSCENDRQTYRCTTKIRRHGMSKTVTEEYRCCHGYRRAEGKHCTTAMDLAPMEQTLQDADLNTLMALAKTQLGRARESSVLNADNMTVFAPSDEAFNDFVEDLEYDNSMGLTTNEVYRRRRSSDLDLKDTVLGHFAKGILHPGDLKDEELLEPMFGKDKLRVNVYKSRAHSVVTVNCAQITGKEIPSQNGMVYLVDSVIKPAQKTLAEIIDTDPQFSKFREMLAMSGLHEDLSSPHNTAGHFTLLAPTDAAFAAMSADSDWLLSNSPCTSAIVKNHVLPNVICSAAILNPQSRTMNLLKNYLPVKLDDGGNMFVGDAQIVAKDIIASNGVMHIIDAPLIPSEAKTVLDVLDNMNLTEFSTLVRQADMIDEIAKMENDFTIFAPSNQAVLEAKEFFDEAQGDKQKLRSAIRYHFAKSTPKELITNNHLSRTFADDHLRMNLYTGPRLLGQFSPLRPLHSRMTAGCSKVHLTDQRACGAVVHVVEEVLRPPVGSVADLLEREATYSIFNKMAKESSLGASFAAPSDVLTVLAPSDHVFRTLPQRELDMLLADSELQEELVQRHTLREHICCSGIHPASLLQEQSRTAYGSTVHFRRTSHGLYKVGPARITQCGKPSSNGVVHSVNRLFVEPHVMDHGFAERRWASHDHVSRPVFSVSPHFSNIFQNMFMNN